MLKFSSEHTFDAGLDGCLRVDPMLHLDPTKAAASFNSDTYVEILNQIANLRIADHVQSLSVFDFRRHVRGSVRTCPSHEQKPLETLDAEHRSLLEAVHAVIKGAQLSQLPVVLWGRTHDDWVRHCILSPGAPVTLMVPHDHIASLQHLRLFHVC